MDDLETRVARAIRDATGRAHDFIPAQLESEQQARWAIRAVREWDREQAKPKKPPRVTVTTSGGTTVNIERVSHDQPK